jgi:hypothetical protein
MKGAFKHWQASAVVPRVWIDLVIATSSPVLSTARPHSARRHGDVAAAWLGELGGLIGAGRVVNGVKIAERHAYAVMHELSAIFAGVVVEIDANREARFYRRFKRLGRVIRMHPAPPPIDRLLCPHQHAKLSQLAAGSRRQGP